MADTAKQQRRWLVGGVVLVALVGVGWGLLAARERPAPDERAYAVVLGGSGRCIARVTPNAGGVRLSYGENAALLPEDRPSTQGLVMQRAVEFVGQTVRIPGGSARIQRVFLDGYGRTRAEFSSGSGGGHVGPLEGGCFPEP